MGIEDIIGFEWDDGNQKKNWLKHKVAWLECEQVFFNEPLFVVPDVDHSSCESRFWALGRTDGDRLLFLSFTVRKGLIRIISARPMSRLEKKIYEKIS